MDYGAESNDRTERKSCGDPGELESMERWCREMERREAEHDIDCHCIFCIPGA